MIDVLSAVAASQLRRYWYGADNRRPPAKHGDRGSAAPILRRLAIVALCMGLLAVELSLFGPL
jgi:hypothetical protein